jgi:hypothetical protein
MADFKEQTDFNDAVNHINRVNGLFNFSNLSKIELNVYGWFHSLIGVFVELSTYMKEDEVAQYIDFIEKRLNDVDGQIKKNSKTGKNEIDAVLYSKLLRFELSLRQTYKKSGLQIRVTSEAEKLLR